MELRGKRNSEVIELASINYNYCYNCHHHYYYCCFIVLKYDCLLPLFIEVNWSLYFHLFLWNMILINIWDAAGFPFCMWIQIFCNTTFKRHYITSSSFHRYKNVKGIGLSVRISFLLEIDNLLMNISVSILNVHWTRWVQAQTGRTVNKIVQLSFNLRLHSLHPADISERASTDRANGL